MMRAHFSRRSAADAKPAKPRRSGFVRRQDGAVTIEFAIVAPLILSIMFTGIDFGVVMIRQMFLDRAVDIAVREVRLGRVTGSEADRFREVVCRNTSMISNCEQNLTLEMRVIDTNSFANVDNGSVRCVNREEEFRPVTEFNPGAGRQELMILRACAVADPFLTLTGFVMGMPETEGGGYAIVARAAWANEPM